MDILFTLALRVIITGGDVNEQINRNSKSVLDMDRL